MVESRCWREERRLICKCLLVGLRLRVPGGSLNLNWELSWSSEDDWLTDISVLRMLLSK